MEDKKTTYHTALESVFHPNKNEGEPVVNGMDVYFGSRTWYMPGLYMGGIKDISTVDDELIIRLTNESTITFRIDGYVKWG